MNIIFSSMLMFLLWWKVLHFAGIVSSRWNTQLSDLS